MSSPCETKRFTSDLSTVSGITSSVISPAETPASIKSTAIFAVSSFICRDDQSLADFSHNLSPNCLASILSIFLLWKLLVVIWSLAILARILAVR